MTRSILAGLLGLFGVALIGAFPLGCQSGGIGDPCTPEDEYNANFAGFKMTEENIESRSFQCASRICLVNHFQGRVTCPLGQQPLAENRFCNPATPVCGTGEKCTESMVLAPDCDPNDTTFCGNIATGMTCNKTAKVCTCNTDPAASPVTVGGVDYRCMPSTAGDAKSLPVLKAFVCHKPGNCQVANPAKPGDNVGKDCCVPGTDTPVTEPVCGQCADTAQKKTYRNAEEAVYCSCRCGVADGDKPDPNVHYCSCPTGFSCEQIRADFHISDVQLTGKYCIKENTEFKNLGNECTKISGNGGKVCSGTP